MTVREAGPKIVSMDPLNVTEFAEVIAAIRTSKLSNVVVLTSEILNAIDLIIPALIPTALSSALVYKNLDEDD